MFHEGTSPPGKMEIVPIAAPFIVTGFRGPPAPPPAYLLVKELIAEVKSSGTGGPGGD